MKIIFSLSAVRCRDETDFLLVFDGVEVFYSEFLYHNVSYFRFRQKYGYFSIFANINAIFVIISLRQNV